MDLLPQTQDVAREEQGGNRSLKQILLQRQNPKMEIYGDLETTSNIVDDRGFLV